MRTQKEQ
jgi:hypothetical protein